MRIWLVTGLLFSCMFQQQMAAVAWAKDAATPEWIWLNSSPKQGETVYFRRTFNLAGELKSAKVVAACDDSMVVFVNGKRVAAHNAWQHAILVDTTKHMVQGKNVVAIQGKNNGSIGALIAQVTLELADGTKQTMVSDAAWRVAAKEQDGWQTTALDDSTWKQPHSFGKLGVSPWRAIEFSGARPTSQPSTPAERISVPEGFEVDLVYSVPKAEQGSWVSMTPDAKGRLIVSDQNGSLYRVTPGKNHESTKVEKIELNIGAAQGLLWAFDCLYVTVNGGAAQGSGFYRVTDTDGDDQLDRVELLKKLRGGGEHGPHGIRLGPDGMLYVIAGNHTAIPDDIEPTSPHRNWAEDLLLPRNPDGRGHATGRMAPAGWVARTDKDGQRWELICAGFRNPYDIDFNQDGELFTYDADMEWDTGTPWYRPTRVNHCVSAGEFGWRFGTGKWPDYQADSLGAVVDIGLGSPTGIGFGTGAKFPAKYQRALYICDWTYGKLYAVHMQPRGASYSANLEVFAQAKPLPLTDVVVNHDGALYFTIGGRGTQSGLYRVSYVGKESTKAAAAITHAAAKKARDTRHELERLQVAKSDEALDFIWPNLNSSDRYIRYAARVALENQDANAWRQRAFEETKINARIQAMLALARGELPELQPKILQRLSTLPLRSLTEQQLVETLRAYGLVFARYGVPDKKTAAAISKTISPLYPHASNVANRELCRLLVYLDAPDIIGRSMKLLGESVTQEDQLFFVFVLRNVQHGWTPEQRRAYFSWMNLAEKNYRGGASFQRFVQQIRKDAVALLTADDKADLKDILEGKRNVEVVKLETTRQFLHNWQMEDLEPMLAEAERGRSFKKGQAAFHAAQCYKCHRFQGQGGATGPDITGVGNRFDAKYLLEALIEPSKVVSDQYANTNIVTVDGEIFSGRIIDQDDKHVRVRTDPYALELTSIAKSDIEEQLPSKVSEMPQGLINVLTKEEILDLIAFMRSGGNREDRVFQRE